MDIPLGDAIKHIPFIMLGIWPVNALTLLVRGHAWAWETTPDAIMGLWEWGAFVSFSVVVLVELGVEMFIALGRLRRRMEQARAEGRKEGRAEGLAEGRAIGLAEARSGGRTETGSMLDVLNAAARTNPDLLPSLLDEYKERYQNGAADNEQNHDG